MNDRQRLQFFFNQANTFDTVKIIIYHKKALINVEYIHIKCLGNVLLNCITFSQHLKCFHFCGILQGPILG